MKTKISLLLLAFFFLIGCQQDRSKIEKGMVKVVIMYANGEGKTFDIDYYTNKHMPLAASLMGDALKGYAVDKGIANSASDAPVPFLAIGYLYFENMEAYKNAMTANTAALRADVPNFTNSLPIIQINEVKIAP